jgi:hypothetical protein
MELTQEKFNQAKIEADAYYRSIGSVKCPYFNNEPVAFNSEGFEHVIFKEWNKTRSQLEQYTRFRLLSLGVSVIKRSGTLQEFDKRNLFVRMKSKNGWNKVMKVVRYYVFVAIFGELRLKVVVKEVEGGQKYFWSIYPSWETKSDINGEKKKKFFSGNPETD